MATGIQSPALERCCYDHIWGPLAASGGGQSPASGET
jgi:hypothetical protein